MRETELADKESEAMNNKELVSILLAHNPEAQVMFMTQRTQPFENYVAGVVGRAEMHDQQGRIEAGISPSDVFLVVGRRIRPGSLSAWTMAEQKQVAADLVDQGTGDAAVNAIVRNLCASAFEGDAETHVWEKSVMVRALHAAYRAGAANTAAQFLAGDPPDIEHDETDGEHVTGELPSLSAPLPATASE